MHRLVELAVFFAVISSQSATVGLRTYISGKKRQEKLVTFRGINIDSTANPAMLLMVELSARSLVSLSM